MTTPVPTRRHVSVGVDASPQADIAVRFGAVEAQLRGVPLLLVHAYQPHAGTADARDIMRQAADAEIVLNDAWARLAPPPSLRVDSRLYQGQPVDLLRDIQAESAMLVLGHRPPDAHVTRATRHLTRRVLAHAGCPVAVTPATSSSSAGPAPVIAAIDPVRPSYAVLRAAFDEARLRRLDLAVLHVVDGDLTATIARAGDEVDTTLSAWRSQCPAVRVRTVWQEGDPARRLSAPVNASVLVVGQHERLHRPWPPSLASRIADLQSVPTIVVPDERGRAAPDSGAEELVRSAIE